MGGNTTDTLAIPSNYSVHDGYNYSTYGICHQFWGSPYARLSALDMSQLAGLTYEQNCDAIKQQLRHTFPGRDVTVHECARYWHFPRQVIFDFHSKVGKSTRVIAYKGTSSKDDIFL